ncbi:acyltransferase family protein [Rhizobium paknamense]|uniref:Peptidoglycan/LPS O-acetylase OafA/YrhL n=1 Tax=Rhizobium paknamense TaxID=1206817 RepID=A0ABU0ICQ3_9HYPH|nr:acyltransferase [Rhizobium paknamense]MDQ0455019.1 peptidoglycan/LPS O-acetylase OafA/YrhL [Rhizobium paknamense]
MQENRSDKSSHMRIACLDGLRGLAALWVLVGHAHLLTGFRVPILASPDLGVDLFILLSGFLMVFHYQLRRDREPWESPATWASFWLRRFFRIAPLYYVLLFVALALGPVIYEARMVIDAFNGVHPQAASRYLDGSVTNHLAHMSFLYGLHPNFAYRTPLPDWSIGLEMQFYAALPFIMLLVGFFGWARGLAGVVAGGVALAILADRAGVHFPMPAFLPLKLHVFAAGMLMAAALFWEKRKAWLALAAALLLVLIPIGGEMGRLHEGVRLLIVTGFFALVHARHLPGRLAAPLTRLGDLLGNRFFHLLGELSFGAYLIHLLIMQPVIAFLITHGNFSNPVRFALSLLVTIPVVYGLAFLGYRFIEVPGQKLGRMVLKRKPAAA